MRTTINKKGKYLDSLERLREAVFLRGNDAVAHGDFSRWGFWIASAIIAFQIALLFYKASSHVEQYPQFVVGQIAWRAASKSQDFNLVLGLVFGFLAALLILLLLAGRIRKRIVQRFPSATSGFGNARRWINCRNEILQLRHPRSRSIWAGFAHSLKERGETSFLVIKRDEEVGGLCRSEAWEHMNSDVAVSEAMQFWQKHY